MGVHQILVLVVEVRILVGQLMLDILINSITNDFDLSFCIVVNIATYIIIRGIDDANGKKSITTWQKRLVLAIVIFIVAIVYYVINISPKVIINSAIAAPVTWSWLFKPICNMLGIDYKQLNNIGD